MDRACAGPRAGLAGPSGYDAGTPGRTAPGPRHHRGGPVQTLDEMLSRHLLTPHQHGEIEAWIAKSPTPEEILRMPPPLWRTLALASVLMDVDADLTQPPLLSEG